MAESDLPRVTMKDAQGNDVSAVSVRAKKEFFLTTSSSKMAPSSVFKTVVAGVFRIEGKTDAAGLPLYSVQAIVLPSVVGTKKEGPSK